MSNRIFKTDKKSPNLHINLKLKSFLVNTKISNQLFDYKIHKTRTQFQKVILYSKPGFKLSLLKFRVYKKYLTQIW